jgi:hypothetical protein
MTKVLNNKASIAKVICLMVVAGLMATLATMAFADGSADIIAAVKKVCVDIGGIMTAIINPICAVIIGICIIRLIFGANSKSADSSIQWIKRVVIGFVCFNLIGLFLQYGTSLMTSVGGQSKWS